MTTHTVSPENVRDSAATVNGIQHVGHVVRDIATAIGRYRRMGFVVPPPSFPALARRPGEPLRAFGAGNTHISFRRTFVELVTVADDREGLGADATLVPLQAPAEALDRLTDSIEETASRISKALTRFEGLHILVFRTADVDATIGRLAAQGVAHGAVNRLRRPVTKAGVTTQVSIGYVEIDSDAGLSPEGRLALAEDGPGDAPPLRGNQGHPNGAIELVESVLCVPDGQLADYDRRYARYLQRPSHSNGPLRVFDLGEASVRIVPDSALGIVLPGEMPPGLPSFVGYGVAVRDLRTTRDILQRAGFPVRRSPSGAIYVPAAAALGAAVIFRAA
jgi:Glyoxalase-like domain